MAAQQTRLAVGTQITYQLAGRIFAGEISSVEPMPAGCSAYDGEQSITVELPNDQYKEIRGRLVRTRSA